MKKKLRTTPLRRDWTNHPSAKGLLGEKDFSVHNRARLHCKVLVFDTKKNMERFWSLALGLKLRGALGAVNCLGEIFQKDGVDEYVELDPRYFCVCSFVKRHLNTEVLIHEMVHVGEEYQKRVGFKGWPGEDGMPVEGIAYPAGIIGWQVNKWLHENNLYP